MGTSQFQSSKGEGRNWSGPHVSTPTESAALAQPEHTINATHAHTHTRTHARAHAHTRTHADTCPCQPSNRLTFTHFHTHTRMAFCQSHRHRYTDTRTHAHTHAVPDQAHVSPDCGGAAQNTEGPAQPDPSFESTRSREQPLSRAGELQQQTGVQARGALASHAILCWCRHAHTCHAQTRTQGAHTCIMTHTHTHTCADAEAEAAQ